MKFEMEEISFSRGNSVCVADISGVFGKLCHRAKAQLQISKYIYIYIYLRFKLAAHTLQGFCGYFSFPTPTVA
jgi:hypothetical protein